MRIIFFRANILVVLNLTVMQAVIDYLNGIYPMSAALELYLRSILHERLFKKNQFALKSGDVCSAPSTTVRPGPSMY